MNTSTTDVRAATDRAMARGMLTASQGQPPEDVVNAEVLLRPGFLAKLARFAENTDTTPGPSTAS